MSSGIYKDAAKRKAYLRAYYKAHREEIKARHKDYYQEHKEVLKKASNERYRRLCEAQYE
jgi:hypothetical protein